jgi:hypothetical protein
MLLTRSNGRSHELSALMGFYRPSPAEHGWKSILQAIKVEGMIGTHCEIASSAVTKSSFREKDM